ncbi:response regulator [Nitratireductor mangrovi]|uniref:Response regulator n=1 Tax=Nitratireductor mangrovi TaxID=2599600 RepID=A0A5B8L2C9_9HYPH|nr:response regulator [Nitratireductor mangrovi]QDZ02116.2 response regulator [Nitratireductor mangrovi]
MEKGVLAGKSILIVEDEALLALGLEQDLQDAGYQTVGPYRTLADARRAASEETIDAGILDINLNGELSYPVAEQLLRRGIPFLFVSGYGGESIPEDFRHFPRLAKPYDPADLMRRLKELA